MTSVEGGSVGPNTLQPGASYTHPAAFAETRVDEELAVVRTSKIVCAAAAGRNAQPEDDAQPTSAGS
jgi:xanthine dehydrogenase YagR molybdenum-binding subunit